MDWFYLQMIELHRVLAWCSVLFFLARGLIFQFGDAWAERAMDGRIQLLVFGVDMLLTISGLSLWVLLHFNPLRDGWLMAKLLALLAYTLCAHWAMGRGEFRILGYVAALLLLAYMMGVSITRQALPVT
jgi:uncharacterized membrane protein SirB2